MLGRSALWSIVGELIMALKLGLNSIILVKGLKRQIFASGQLKVPI